MLHYPGFLAGDFDTSFVETAFAEADRRRERPVTVAVAAAALAAFLDRQQSRLGGESNGSRHAAWWEAGLREAQRGRT